jgi:hypothetical protein
MPIIPALRRLRQKNQEFKATLSYIARSCLNNNKDELERPVSIPVVKQFFV